jgi:steroid delta-isomerase-like uncharacterized protein
MMTRAAAFPVVAQRWMDAWNARDPQAMCELFTADGIYEDTAFKIRAQGRQGVAAWIKISIDHIPDLRGEIDDAFQANDRVAVRWMFSGTPRMLGPVQGTGKPYSVPVLTIMELREGLIARVTDCYNLADLLQQIELPLDSFPLSASWRTL